MKTLPKRPAPGFTMIEMLALLILISAAAVLTTRLFVATTKLSDRAVQAHTDAAKIDAVVRALRADVWGAADLWAPDSHSLTLRNGAVTVHWTIADSDGTLVRNETRDGRNDERRWPAAAPKSTFQVDGSLVRLAIPDSKRARGGQVHLASQLRLAQGSAS